jgi:predicted aspartyl protease
MSAGLLWLAMAAPLAADTTPAATPAGQHAAPQVAQASPQISGAPSSPQAPAPSPAAQNLPSPAQQLEEVIVQTTEPRYVAPTRRDRIGRIWAPVLIDGKGPYRMVLDTGANHSAIAARAALSLGGRPVATTLVTGFTGSATVPTLHVNSLEVGELLFGPTDLPVLPDVFGGAQGVLGFEGLQNKRIYADFTRDRLEITISHGERARRDFTVIPLKEIKGGLLCADVRVGTVRARAIVDTGAQATIGNLALRDALMRHRSRNDVHEDIIGVTLDVQSGDNMPAPDIDFGRLQVKGAHITFGDMYLFQHWRLTDEPTLMLGMDLLGSFDALVIDYNRHELWIRARDMDQSGFTTHY